jgi:dynein heavy chain
MGASSAESLGGASIGSVHSGVVLPLRQTSDDCSITAASEIFRLREPVASPIRSDDGLLTFEASPSVRTASQNQMSLRDLSEIKALKKPPPPIRMLMEVCCLLFHIQPLKQADERNAKKFKLDYWEPARRYLLSDPFFLSKLRMYKPDEISSTQRMKIKKYFQDPEFTAERLKTCSKAAYELYEWVSQLVQSEVVSNVPETRRNPLMAGSLRRRESPPCARTPQLSSAS